MDACRMPVYAVCARAGSIRIRFSHRRRSAFHSSVVCLRAAGDSYRVCACVRGRLVKDADAAMGVQKNAVPDASLTLAVWLYELAG